MNDDPDGIDPIWKRAERLGLYSRSLPWGPGNGELLHVPGWPGERPYAYGVRVMQGTPDEAHAFFDRLDQATAIVNGLRSGGHTR